MMAERTEHMSFRGKGRLLNALCPRVGIAERRVFGHRVRLDLSDHIQRWIFLGIYEHAPTRIVSEYLRPEMTVVDVGANVGYYTLLALSRIGPRGRVIAVEPAERPRQRLLAAVDGMTNVTVIPCAVGAERGSGVLYLNRDADNDTPTMVSGHGGIAAAVEIETLDACLAALGVQNVDLLKLDVEGWEPRVLTGAQSLLARRRIRAILCELNDYWLRAVGTSAEAVHRQILALGFEDVAPHALSNLDTRLFVLTEIPSAA